MAEKWIQGAINPAHKGLLHRELHIPEGHKIPQGRIEKAEHANNPHLAKQARLAETLSHLRRKCGGSV
jgi:hypothetical protein